MGISKRFRSYFLKGLAVLLPTLLTIWILAWGYTFIQDNITKYINMGLVQLILLIENGHGISKMDLDDILVTGPGGSVIGFIIALVLVFFVGALLASVVGRVLWKWIETFIMSTPILRQVYPYVKQITDFVLTQEEQQKMFSRVVAVETGSGLQKIGENVQKEMLSIMVPNSPTPLTGYVIMVPKEQTIALDLTMEEAFRFIISAGVVSPDRHRMSALPRAYTEDRTEQ